MRGLNRISSKTRIRGFTLIEIMIIVAVIGILAAIALPAYQDYTVRSKVSEGLGFASAAKVAVVSAYGHGGLPASNTEAGLSEAGDFESQYVESVEIEEGGNIRVTFNGTIPQLTGKSVMLAATERGGAIDWCCYSSDIEARYMPASCRDGERCGVDTEIGGSDDDVNEGDGNDSDDDKDNTTKCPEPLTPTGESGKCKRPKGIEICPDGWSKNGRNCTKQ